MNEVFSAEYVIAQRRKRLFPCGMLRFNTRANGYHTQESRGNGRTLFGPCLRFYPFLGPIILTDGPG